VKSFFTAKSFSVTLALPKLLSLGNEEKQAFLLHFSRFSVTLEDFAGFLCIKTMQRIEKFWGYDLEIVLNSMFCYKLPKRTPDSETPPVSWLVVRCKGTHLFPISIIFSWRNIILY